MDILFFQLASNDGKIKPSAVKIALIQPYIKQRNIWWLICRRHACSYKPFILKCHKMISIFSAVYELEAMNQCSSLTQC